MNSTNIIQKAVVFKLLDSAGPLEHRLRKYKQNVRNVSELMGLAVGHLTAQSQLIS